MQKIFHSATSSTIVFHVLASQDKIRKVAMGPIPGRALLSFAYYQTFDWFVEHVEENDIEVEEIFLDSGAFSAWSKGDVIDIDEYAKYVFEANECDRIGRVIAANLDHIPGKAGNRRQLDASTFEEAARVSYENYEYLRKLGVPGLMPVYHAGEDTKWLDRMLEHCEYICFGGIARTTRVAKTQWLDRAFEHIDKVGAKVKVHGLGVTTVDVMRRFPWYSVDSSTACLAAGMGIAILPRFDHGGQFIFDESPYTLKVGDRILSGTKPRGTREVEAADGSTYFTKGIEEKEGLFDTRADIQMARTTQGHARILSAKRRKMIERYLSQYGYVYDDIYDYAKRIEINVIFMFNLEQSQEVYRNEKVEAYKGLGL